MRITVSIQRSDLQSVVETSVSVRIRVRKSCASNKFGSGFRNTVWNRYLFSPEAELNPHTFLFNESNPIQL